MNIKVFKNLINELIEQGIKVQDLTLIELSNSIKLYKMLNSSIII